jgi:hypothetical protein
LRILAAALMALSGLAWLACFKLLLIFGLLDIPGDLPSPEVWLVWYSTDFATWRLIAAGAGCTLFLCSVICLAVDAYRRAAHPSTEWQL